MKIGDIYSAEKYSEIVSEANSLGLLINIQEDGSLLIGEQTTSDEELARREISSLRQYLSETDWTVIKCMETGVSLSSLYPEISQKRTAARNRINELEAQYGINS